MKYQAGDQVRGLVNIQLSDRKMACTPGYLFTVESVNLNGSLIVTRDECGGKIDRALVKPEDVEPAYVVVNGTYYSSRMSPDCIRVLELCREEGCLVHLHHGYTSQEFRHVPKEGLPKPVGLDWLEEFDCRGRIGRSMGPIKVPLLVPRKCDGGDGFGGGAICNAIVKIRKLNRNGETERVLYRHPQYRMPSVSLHPVDETHQKRHYAIEVKVDGDRQALFTDWKECRKWCQLFEIAPRFSEEKQEVLCLQ